MDDGGIPKDWVPSPPPEIGGLRWRRNILEESLGRCHSKCKAFDCGDEGIFVCERTSGGWNYFWADKENFTKVPKVNWDELAKKAIGGN